MLLVLVGEMQVRDVKDDTAARGGLAVDALHEDPRIGAGPRPRLTGQRDHFARLVANDAGFLACDEDLRFQ